MIQYIQALPVHVSAARDERTLCVCLVGIYCEERQWFSLTSSDQEISVHQIFGRNLRELCKRTDTIAEVADHLGVNRVQMNRILIGESFPKPGLTKRIYDHFFMNARILLEPLAELEAKKRNQSPGDVRGMPEPFDYAFFGRDYSFNEGNVNVKWYLMACIWWSANPLCGVMFIVLGWCDFSTKTVHRLCVGLTRLLGAWNDLTWHP